jgi:aryl-alcohol dehydrogenase-like predicted oxidoreductase
MEMRQLGNTGLEVSRLGVGLSELGSRYALAQKDEAGRVLNMALDQGLNFLDAAACYGTAEELVGETISHRRQDFVFATKAGHVVGDYSGSAWTAETVRHSIERSLRRARTDYLDLVQLHSCSTAVLERGEVIQALLDAREAGKTRFIGYSGDNESALWAVEHDVFDTLETSFNLVDQRARTELFSLAQGKSMGIIAKRPIANAAWGRTSSPSFYAREYFRRAQIVADRGPVPGAPEDPIVLALGFTLAHDAVDTAIVGTADPDHMRSNVRMVEEELPIPREAVDELERRFDEVGERWAQEG